jgi:hypothetical protein
VAGSELVFPVRRLAAEGLEAWKQVVARGDEGYVAKAEASAYDRNRRGVAAMDQLVVVISLLNYGVERDVAQWATVHGISWAPTFTTRGRARR